MQLWCTVEFLSIGLFVPTGTLTTTREAHMDIPDSALLALVFVGYDYRTQRYKDADALYAFKSRGFSGEIGLVGRTSGL